MKKYLILSIMFIALTILFCPITLGGEVVADSTYFFEDKTVTYNAGYQTIRLTGTLPEGYSVTYENAIGINAGEYVANANIYNGTELIETLTATLTIEKADITGITFESGSFIYDGTGKSIEVDTLKLFDGTTASVSYAGNGETDYREEPYAVTAIVDGGDNFNVLTLQSYYYITRADYDMSGITFSGASVEFDGNAHSIEISGSLPDGVSVEYTNNGKTKVGDHSVVAKFTTTNNNYNAPQDMRAMLNITQRALTITFLDTPLYYTGAKQDVPVEIKGIIDGYDPIINYSYSTTPINAGDYSVTVSAYSSNYYIKGENVGYFKINKASLTAPKHKAFDITYNPNNKLSNIELDSGFTFVDGTMVPTCNKNEYAAIYNIDSVNYEDCAVMITINVAKATYGVEFPTPTGITYGENLSASALDSDIDYGSFAWSKPTLIPNVSHSEYECVFTPNDAVNYNVETKVLTLTIAPKVLSIEFTNYDSVVYNGSEQKNVRATISGVLPMDDNAVTLSLSYNGNAIYAGKYIVTAVINNTNYALPEIHSVEYEILKANYEKPTIEDLIISKSRDAITISHELPFKCRQVGGQWQTSISLHSLKEMTDYNFEFFILGNTNYNDSEVLEFTIKTNCSIQTCNDAINAIGTVTLNSYSAIAYAFECYRLVGSDDKAQCDLAKLNSAKAAYNNIVNQNNSALDMVISNSTSILNSIAKIFNIWFILALALPLVIRRVI